MVRKPADSVVPVAGSGTGRPGRRLGDRGGDSVVVALEPGAGARHAAHMFG